jgi:predicted Rossmann-fold nucleotide-binding protein
LNVRGFFDPLLALFNRAVADGLLNQQNREIVFAADDPAVLIDHLSTPIETPEPKWILDPQET